MNGQYDVVLIVPVYNEELNIRRLLDNINLEIPIILVDDGSKDTTHNILMKLEKDKENIFVITHIKNLGMGASLESGFKYSLRWFNPRYILFMDGDYQHDPNDISKFIRHMQEGYDLVIGERSVREMSLIHCIGNIILRFVCFILTREISDPETGFRMWKSSSLNKIRFSSGYEISHTSFIQAKKMKFKIKKIKITQLRSETKGTTIEVGLRILFHCVVVEISYIYSKVVGRLT